MTLIQKLSFILILIGLNYSRKMLSIYWERFFFVIRTQKKNCPSLHCLQKVRYYLGAV
jgi:hypothetical protein